MSLVVKALLFDLDGTLANSLDSMKSVYYSFLRAHGETGTEEEFENLNGVPIKDVPIILGKSRSINKNNTQLIQQYKDLVLRAYELIEPTAGAVELLKVARSKGWKSALVTSNWELVAQTWLKTTGLSPYFSTVVGMDSVTHGKPAPDIYLLALKKLNCQAINAIAIEDSRHGIVSAQGAGLRVFMYSPNPLSTPPQKVSVINHFSALQEEIS